MKHYAADYYAKPKTKIDEDDDSGWLLAHCLCAISGGIVGFLIGYNLKWFLGLL